MEQQHRADHQNPGPNSHSLPNAGAETEMKQQQQQTQQTQTQVSIPMMESEKETLLESSAAPSVADEASSGGTDSNPEPETKGPDPAAVYKKRRRRSLMAGGCCIGASVILALLGLILLILSLTLFKSRQPVMRIKSVSLQSLSISNLNTTELAELVAEGRVNVSDPAAAIMELGSSLNLTDVRVSLTLGVEVGVYNPNRASFRYTNSTSYLYYRDVQVGEAAIPAGHIGALSSEALNTTMTLNASTAALLGNPHLFLDLAAGSFPMSTTAQVSGRLNFLNVFKHHARSSTHCTMSVSLARRAVEDMLCTYRVRLRL